VVTPGTTVAAVSKAPSPVSNVLPRINIAAKVALVALLIHAVAFPDLPQYEGKGIGWRILIYPVSGLLVPLVWRLLGERTRRWRYPHLIDLCVIAPFLVDTAGNAANFYDSIVWWDDVMHFVTWVPWVVGFGLALRYVDGLARWTVFGLTVGFGAVTHIAWELMEYVAFIRTNPDELEGAYRDTMGDLTLSLTGSFTGAALCATVLWTLGRPVAADPPAEGPPRSDPMAQTR
jgi:hypothetical protein